MKRIFLAAFMSSTALVVPTAGIAQTTPVQPNVAAADANQVRPIAVSQINGKDVYNLQGKELGEVDRVILGQGDQVFAVIKFGEFLGLGGEARILPLSRMALREDRIVVPAMTEAEFKALPAWRAGLAGYRDAEPVYQVGFPIYVAVVAPVVPGAEGSRIVVQQAAPVIKVDPADPRVTVRQTPPTVTVNQARPEILVRQPAPTVTIDIPQPEIIVRMPQPDVNVAMAQPQVSVNQPPPQVQVVRPQQPPQVQVQPSQPQVLVQRPVNTEANVNVQRPEQQPIVRYERAEPKVVVNQAPGQPQVRMEGAGANQVRPVAVSEIRGKDVYNLQGKELGEVERVILGQGDQVFAVIKFGEFLGLGGEARILPLSRMALREDRIVVPAMTEAEFKALPAWRDKLPGYRIAENTYRAPLPLYGAGNATATAPVTAEDRRRILRERLGLGDVSTTATITPPTPAPTRAVRIVDLEGKNVYNLRNEELGEIERVIVNPANNQQYAILEFGGFLGFGESKVAIPLNRIQMRGERLVVRGLTEAELDAMPDWERRIPKHRELADNITTNLTIWQ